ncbi:MAG: PPOX class F420-dependent oxidoreductase [Mycobacterium sp.]|jgi:PPOX class probable F420-dependent enzyme
MSDAITQRLGDEEFVSLITYKRSGDAVATAMWVVRDGDRLLMWTPAAAWKVKRVRHNPRVTLTRCSRSGKVKPGEQTYTGTAEVITDPAVVDHAHALVKQKYGLQYWVIMTIETIVARGRTPRTALGISLQPSAQPSGDQSRDT